ncbi:transmembrane 6 superfamily member 1 isoform X2 [Oncorhynchus tshawytscha]|uniref:transmembrane 6 superfamily member 1 isoform X2 n=1 Tax=Oncorhynchus tshawytscha TaxID=74940 RepID=UPI001C3C64DA|nr:transmembrane 6 superfamily member 1 isoform X2 [Oncorhynchus tshawytscha]
MRVDSVNRAMHASAGTGVFILSLTPIPISFFFNSLIYTNSIETVFFAGSTTVLILAISACFLFKKKAPKDPLFYVFAVYAFLSVVNLIIGLEQDSIIDGFITFYLKNADPYINTAHGHMISYWDGCVHYLMYLHMVAAITWGASYRAIGLYWVGSILMRVIVYIPGNVVGKYGTQLSPLFLVHMLYVVVSVWACFRVFSQSTTRQARTMSINEVQRTTLVERPLDFLFVIYLVPATFFCVFRGLMIVNMLYSGPYYIIALYGLLVPGCEWMPDLTLVHSGAIAQAQFSHIGASLHTRTPFSYRVPADSQIVFLLVNALYAIVPQALCYRCVTSPAFFLRDQQNDKRTD